MPQALQSGVPSSASLHSGVLFTLHDAHVLAAADVGWTGGYHTITRNVYILECINYIRVVSHCVNNVLTNKISAI